MLIEFRVRAAGATRVFINPDHVIAVYVRADGCFIVTREQVSQGGSLHLLVDEPVPRVLAKLGCEISPPPLPPQHPPRVASSPPGEKIAAQGGAANEKRPEQAEPQSDRATGVKSPSDEIETI